MGYGKGLLKITMKILDTNVVLRYLLKDVPDMFEIANTNIKQGDCTIYPEVVAEVVYVLKSVYKVGRIDISNSVICFLDEVISERKEAIVRGLSLFAETSLDFVDCLLIAYHECYGYDVLTFDKKMNKKLM